MPSKKTTAQFLKDAVGVHGAKYDYSLVKYVNSSTKVIIKCSEHGEFQQSPNAHLRGSGCRKCGSPTLTPPLKEVDQLMNLWDEETNIVDPKTLLLEAILLQTGSVSMAILGSDASLRCMVTITPVKSVKV